MAWLDSLTWFSIISFLVALIFWSKSRSNSSKLRPPGPPGWPLVGNIFDVGRMPHENFHKLRSKYGPVVWLKLGTLNTVVIQSAAAAAELFKKHDAAFSDRRVPDSLTACDYHTGSLSQSRYGEYWRVLRRLCSSELMIQKRINASAPLRQKCIEGMIQCIKEDVSGSLVGGGSGEVQLDKYLFLMSFNLVGNFMLSRDIMDLRSEAGNEFFDVMNKFMEWNGKPNLSDTFGFLKWVDPQGIRRNTEKYLGQLLNLSSGFVKERIQERQLGRKQESKDFLDALLEYQGDGKRTFDKLSEKNVTIMILEMFFGGTETTSGTIQWAMAELLRNPKSMSRLKTELYQVVGKSRPVQEDDLNELPYLQAVVKETMRLHPSLPLLLPRNAIQDTEFMGYIIPKDTMVILNAWAIHRDPDSWEDPFSFRPDRFLNSNIDNKGQHYELIPFGSGRRSCVGMLLGDKMISLTLALLIQAFDWELPGGISRETLDMSEMMSISLRMLIPLKAIPVGAPVKLDMN
ncbi:UNVERIFIED_CONTAM: Iridoid oxidase [Sesamum calycinum]|uniref:Iridoid oxidase n=1 Tax=Sesamum calycinum TaxID=2727403 RepID=A0AAW2N232_9LAMI